MSLYLQGLPKVKLANRPSPPTKKTKGSKGRREYLNSHQTTLLTLKASGTTLTSKTNLFRKTSSFLINMSTKL